MRRDGRCGTLGAGIREGPSDEQTTCADLLAQLVAGRAADEAVFRNRRGRPLTRSGMLNLVKRCPREAARRVPSLAARNVSPHVVRHTTATHLHCASSGA